MSAYLAFGAIEHLRCGWAIIPFVGTRPHYWIEEECEVPYIDAGGIVRFYRSRCGMEATTDSKRPAIIPGNFPLCKRCAGRRMAA